MAPVTRRASRQRAGDASSRSADAGTSASHAAVAVAGDKRKKRGSKAPTAAKTPRDVAGNDGRRTDTTTVDVDAAAKITTTTAAAASATSQPPRHHRRHDSYRDVPVSTDTDTTATTTITLRELCANAPCVLFLVPKANTPGCNRQYAAFTRAFDEFQRRGYAVYVCSRDTPAALAKWREKNRSAVRGLSDPRQALIEALGARKGGVGGGGTVRSHFVLAARTAEVIEAQVPVSPDKSCALALAFVDKAREGV